MHYLHWREDERVWKKRKREKDCHIGFAGNEAQARKVALLYAPAHFPILHFIFDEREARHIFPWGAGLRGGESDSTSLPAVSHKDELYCTSLADFPNLKTPKY